MGMSSAQKVARLRARRRKGRLVTPLETDAEERRKLVVLGYLSAEGRDGDRAALTAAVQAYFSDKIAAEGLD
jgi:hypothetical protein